MSDNVLTFRPPARAPIIVPRTFIFSEKWVRGLRQFYAPDVRLATYAVRVDWHDGTVANDE